MDNERIYTVYRHISPSGKMYVGITSMNPSKRWGCGNGYKNNDYFYRAIKKYGWDNFKHEILLSNLSKEEADFAEKVMIQTWRLTDRDKGYNIHSGGIKHYKHSKETREKMSKAATGRTMSEEAKAKMSAYRKGKTTWMKGKHHTIESKKKMSEAAKRRTYDAETRYKISQRMQGQSHPMYGKKHTEESRMKMRESHLGKKQPLSVIKKISKPVAQYDKNGTLIRTYYGASEASEITGINRGNIGLCCQHKRKTAGGYVWKYINK